MDSTQDQEPAKALDVEEDEEEYELLVLTDLPHYDDIKGCPKCGETTKFSLKRLYCDDSCLADEQEHLHLTCEKCGYQQMSRCADAQKGCVKPAETPKGKEGVTTREPLVAGEGA